MDTFTTYLHQRQLAPTTITQYLKCGHQFLHWLSAEALKAEEVNYQTMLHYISQMKEKGYTKRKIMHHLGVIRHYFTYLIQTQTITHNPAAGLYIKGITRRIPHNLLETKTLESLYENYQATNPIKQQNRIMLGLIVYQALTLANLENLHEGHINLKEGKIYIPATSRSAARTLKLQASQILELQEYLHQFRAKREAKTIQYTKENPPQLFTSRQGQKNLSNEMAKLFRELKTVHPSVKDADQLRQSVISGWLTHHNLRTVQYMAGHKYVSSTERYRQTHLEELKTALDKHHPLQPP